MPIVVNEVSVEPAPAAAPPPAPPAAPAGGTNAAIADTAERHWKRVADLEERVRAD
jgi:hypothetical protein